MVRPALLRWGAVAVGAAVVVTVLVVSATRLDSTHSTAVTTTAASTSAPSEPSRVAARGTGTWAASTDLTDRQADDQTVREVVALSAGGTGVSLSLSNAYGTQPITVAHMTIGVQAQGAAVAAGSLSEVTFNRQASVTIPVGGEVVSDVANRTVPDATRLVVSLFIPAASGPMTGHVVGNENAYFSTAGDWTSDLSADQFRQTADGKYFLDAVYIAASDAVTTVATFGDSITDGVGSTFGADVRWPDRLSARAIAEGHPIGVLNEGIASNQLLSDSPAGRGGRSGVTRFAGDVLARQYLRTVIELIGINDLTAIGATATQLEVGLNALVTAAHAQRICVVGGTVMPFNGGSDSLEEQRQALNTWIRTSGEFDAVADFDAATRDPDNPRDLRSALDSGDGLHPNDAGHQALANAVDLDSLVCAR